MEKVINLDMCFSRPSFHFCAAYQMSGGVKVTISDGGLITEAAEALSWSKFSAVLKKMCAHLHPQRCKYGAVAQAPPWLIYYTASWLRLRAFVLVLAHSNTNKLKQFVAPVRHRKKSRFAFKKKKKHTKHWPQDLTGNEPTDVISLKFTVL